MSSSALGPQFHATRVAGWHPGEHDPDAIVHVGTRQSATDRGSESFNPNAEYPEHVEARFHPGGRFDLHELHIDPSASVHPNVLPDDERVFRDTAKAHPEHDVFPYANEHEDAGSTSYAVRARALRPSRVEAFTGKWGFSG